MDNIKILQLTNDNQSHVYCVENNGDTYSSVFPEPLCDMHTSYNDEVSAWIDIVMTRSTILGAEQWPIQNKKRCAEVLWSHLGNIPFDEDEDGDLVLGADWMMFHANEISQYEIWQWFEEEFGVMAAVLLGNAPQKINLGEYVNKSLPDVISSRFNTNDGGSELVKWLKEENYLVNNNAQPKSFEETETYCGFTVSINGSVRLTSGDCSLS